MFSLLPIFFFSVISLRRLAGSQARRLAGSQARRLAGSNIGFLHIRFNWIKFGGQGPMGPIFFLAKPREIAKKKVVYN